MSKAGDRLIASANEAASIAKGSVDCQMLQSMATALRYDLQFSFNREDMADLLERAAVAMATVSEQEGGE